MGRGLTYFELAKKVLEESNIPLNGNQIWENATKKAW